MKIEHIELITKIYFNLWILLILPVSGSSVSEIAGIQSSTTIKSWNTSTGLPHNTIRTIIQSKNGYIWAGTPSGLVRFDGMHFKLFSHEIYPALKSNTILTLCEDREGVLWIGTDGGGLVSYKNGEWKNYSRQNGLSNNHIRSLIQDWHGNLWIGTDYGLNKLNKNGIISYTTDDGLYDNIITCLEMDYQGNLLVGTLRGGFATFNDGVIHVYNFYDGLKSAAIQTLKTDHQGILWIGTLEGLYYLEPGSKIIKFIPDTRFSPVTSITDDEKQNLWVGTMTDGIKKIHNKQLKETPIPFTSSETYVHCIINDLQGNIWIGSDTRGLIQVKNSRVQKIASISCVDELVVTTLIQDHTGLFWIGTRNRGLLKIKDNAIIGGIDITTGLSGNFITSLFEDLDHHIWIGTRNGLYKLTDGKMNDIQRVENLSSNHITIIFQDKLHVIWVGTENGLNQIGPDKIHSYTSNNGFINPFIRTIQNGNQGEMLVGTTDGLYRQTGNHFKRIYPDNIQSEIHISSLYQDNDGYIWIGTNGNGLHLFPAKNRNTCTITDGLPDNSIFSIAEDNSGRIWISSYQGVFNAARQQLLDYFDGRIRLVPVRWYNESDGMISSHCTGDGQPSMLLSDKNIFYYPTIGGVSVIKNETPDTITSSPQAVIGKIIADHIQLNRFQPIELPSDTRQLQFYYSAPDFNAPDKIRFRYKLDGLEQNWNYHYHNSDRVVSYPQIEPGKYQFIIQASYYDGDWEMNGDRIEFEIIPPFYQQTHVLISVIVIVLLGTILILYFIQKQKFKKHAAKYKTSPVDPDKKEETIQSLINLMQTDRLFLDPNLTLKDLSRKLRIHYNILSRIINEKFGLNFNDFLNQYRIEEAKKKLTDIGDKDKSILEILYDCGFNSKSVFNTTFKKFTGQTPSQFRKSNN